MKKLLRLLLLICTILPMASLPAYAEVPTEVSGTFTYLPDCTEEIRGVNLFLHCTDIEWWTGDLDGEALTEYWAKFYPSGAATFSSKGVFYGSVLGSAPGTAVFEVTGISQAGTDQWQGTWRIGQGSEGLENVHGQGTWYGPEPPTPPPGEDYTFPYDGLVHFDP